MLTYRFNRNILDDTELNADIVLIPVNCEGIMGRGLALEFKNLYHSLYFSYKEYCEDGYLDYGNLLPLYFGGKIFLMFPTKKKWRNNSSIEGIEEGLRTLSLYLKNVPGSRDNLTIAVPLLGCGLGQLDYESDIKPLFEKYFNSTKYNFVVYVRYI